LYRKKIICKYISKQIKILYSVAYVTFKEWAAYRSHMLVSLFVGPTYFLVQYFIWNAIYSQQESLSGLTLDKMLAYYGIVALINYCIMDFADWNLQMLIRTGKFLTFMLRPVSHRFFALSQKIGHRILGLMLEFIPVYLIFYFVFGIKLIPHNFFWSSLSILLSFLMMFYVDYCIGITGFWLIKTGSVRKLIHLARDVFSGVYLPLSMFPGFLQKILLFLPFQFISYVPARVFIGSYSLAGYEIAIPHIVGIQALAVLAMWAISELMWKAGIKRFTGVGA